MSSTRYSLIDALRGFALVNMLAFHFLYDFFVVCGDNYSWALQPWVVVWERFICISFILISGISLNFSRHAYRRGLIVNACGLLITAVTAVVMPEQIIIFGILNLIGCSMILIQVLRKWLEKLNPFAGAAASFALFAFFYGVSNQYVGFFDVSLLELPDPFYRTNYFAAFGIHNSDFFSADYFPLFAWLFLFVCGFFLWRAVCMLRWERFFKIKIPALDFIGRYTLWIYLIHQPLLMGVCFLIFGGI